VETAHTSFDPQFSSVDFGGFELSASCDVGFRSTVGIWADLVFNPAIVSDWSPAQARQGLVALERLTRAITATKTVLVGRLAAGRDTTATIVRETGMSRRNARELRNAAKVVNENSGALNKLVAGDVSAEHLAHLAHISTEMAADLLDDADRMCADDYRNHIDKHRVKRESKTVAEEQHNGRSVTFFTKPNGNVGITIVLPPVAGTEVKTAIEAICDQAWKTKHPDRAHVAGGHDDDPRERRLADAFIELVRGDRSVGKPSVIVVIDAVTLDAHIVPDQSIPLGDALEVMARADVYCAIKTTNPAHLRFGRNTRVASRLQKLAMLVFNETCVAEGCNVSGLDSDAHHIKWFEHGGTTDIENLEFRCIGEQGHHPHIHETGPPD
jgi:hypothetical protein